LEKRRHPRKPVELAATLSLEGTEEVIGGKIRDLSIGGTFFLCSESIPFATRVTMWIVFPKHGSLAIPAVVRWGGQEGVGLQFGLMGARETHAIVEILSAR
jgi:type IV pilus assembly protein PilZ